MSEFLGVPSASIEGVERVDVREAYDRIDTGHFNARRAELFPAYKRFLEANGLQHRL
jgi:hypothetical protein